MNYSYKATVIRIVDGDTVWLEVDLGFRMKTINDFRLYGVDTPERGQPGWSEAKEFVNKMAPPGTEVTIDTYKDPDKYGRWLVEITLQSDNRIFRQSINLQLMNAGLAKSYFGGHK